MSSYESNLYFRGNGTYKAVNPLVSRVGDFTPFYITIAICTMLLSFLLVLNIVCCCSRYSDYWLDRHTGNRWIVSIWSATPHKQPPLDFTELESQHQLVHYTHPNYSDDYETNRLEEVPTSFSQQPLTHDYHEMHKRESDL